MAEEVRCCICNELLTPPYQVINQRAYCARHYEAVNRPHPGFWRASVIQIAGMAVRFAGGSGASASFQTLRSSRPGVRSPARMRRSLIVQRIRAQG